MLNAVRMDLYRMFHTKSLYVIWIVMGVLIVFTTSLSKTDYEDTQIQAENHQFYQEQEENGENTVMLGMQVILPTDPGEKVTLSDILYANIQGKFVAVFLAIFAVLFSSADMNSGYLKNIGGQINGRWKLIVSKIVALGIYVLLTFGVFLFIQAVSNQIIFGYLKLGITQEFLGYLGVQLLLHLALALICMASAVILRSSVFSMILAVGLCMNLLVSFYGAIDNLIHNLGFEDFRLLDHTVTGQLSMLTMRPSGADGFYAAGVAAAYILVCGILTGLIFTKRDIE